MTLTDSHAHLQFEDFRDEILQVLERARAAGVTTLVNVGTTLESSREAIVLAKQYPQIFAAVGVHPHDVAKMGENDLKEFEGLARERKVVAIGEVGLDYYYEHSPRETQQSRLRDFIRLAHKVKLPLIIHCRDAFADGMGILDEEKGWDGGGVFHCYTGDLATAKKIIDRGFYISFSGIITFKKTEGLREVARGLPLDRILIETDCPFLAPEPYRGKRNEPAYVRRVAEVLGEVRGMSLKEIAEATAQNARRLFCLEKGI